MPRDWPDPKESLIPEAIFGYVALDSKGGTSVLTADNLQSADPFRGAEGASEKAEKRLNETGLTIIAKSDLGCAVVGTRDAYQNLTGATVVADEVLVHGRAGRRTYVTYLDLQGRDHPPDRGVAYMNAPDTGIEAVLLEQPPSPHEFPSPKPAFVRRFHLRPDEVARLTHADEAHARNITGDRVTIAMVDSGHYRHPYFAANQLEVSTPVPVLPGTNAGRDPLGHGTGESANVFAVAPKAHLMPYRVANDAGKIVAPLAGFMRAKADAPSVITCSWGGDFADIESDPPAAQKIAALEIRDAIEKRIVVVFSAGNGGFSIEPQVNGVISAGGVYFDGSRLRASDYASAYQARWYPGRSVPTLCGLVGMRPRGSYLLLPIPPGSIIDQERSAAAEDDPPDGTTSNDGWALFSGTSAAAPQIAGAAALVLQANPGATPAEVSEILTLTATDVTTGRCHPRWGFRAGPGHDIATGAGLVNAFAAAMLASPDSRAVAVRLARP
jgi:subtilisin family serine protease